MFFGVRCVLLIEAKEFRVTQRKSARKKDLK